jgi:hypothetical protein
MTQTLAADVQGCPAFDHLCLTGGAIGSGPPMAIGAAVAAPQRQVINLQADGSAMYTLQVGSTTHAMLLWSDLTRPPKAWVSSSKSSCCAAVRWSNQLC